MPLDSDQDTAEVKTPRASQVSPRLMLAGVVGACVLGAGLGHWARPTEFDPAPPKAKVPSAARTSGPAPNQIEIRVDQGPFAPELAGPLHAEPAPAQPSAAPIDEGKSAPPPEPLAPKGPPEGLVRVRAVAPERLVEAPRQEPAVRREPAPEARKSEPRRAEPAPKAVDSAAAKKTETAKKARLEREARAEAEAAAARKARQEKARIAEAKEAKARKQEQKLAEQRRSDQKLAEKKLAERKAAEKQKAQAAAKAERAKAQRLAEEKAARKTEARLAAARPPAPVKVAAGKPRCSSSDPGAALACADPALGAAERQLTRAYRQAEAAGVPPERLERQQQRWLAARANAARQAPWALHDIYLARIAELQDQTRQASRGE